MSLAELLTVLGVAAVLGAGAVRQGFASAELQSEIRSLEALQDSMRSYYRNHCGGAELPAGGHREFSSPQELTGERIRLAPGLEAGRWSIELFHGAAEYSGADIGRVELHRSEKYARRDRALANYFGGEITEQGAVRWHLLLTAPILPAASAPRVFSRYLRDATPQEVFCHAG